MSKQEGPRIHWSLGRIQESSQVRSHGTLDVLNVLDAKLHVERHARPPHGPNTSKVPSPKEGSFFASCPSLLTVMAVRVNYL